MADPANIQEQTITYEYPDLGRVEVVLRDESAGIYRYIDSEKNTRIEYFERLDQLGALRAVHKTAHHSRWEYMVLQMYLAQTLKSNRAFGLSTSLQLGGHHVSSVEELIKSWVLLNNYGHLLDTFEGERVWLELILGEPKLRAALFECMPDNKCLTLAKQIIEQEDLFRFHHLITLALLRRAAERKEKLGLPFALWVEMVKATLAPARPGSKVERSLNVYRAIRRASYVILDVNRSALFLKLDANNFLRNILNNADSFLYDPESDMTRSLDDVERLLFTSVYGSEECCKFKYVYIRGQKDRFRKIVSKNGIDLYCRNYKMFSTQLSHAKINNFGKRGRHSPVRHICRLSFLPAPPFSRTQCHFHTEEQKLSTYSNKKVDFLVTPAAYPRLRWTPLSRQLEAVF